MRTYTDTDTGQTWPLEEADTDYSFRVYKSDRRKATIANPTACLLALGLKHDKDIAAVYIGSGKDAFVVFKGKGRRPPLARHPSPATTSSSLPQRGCGTPSTRRARRGRSGSPCQRRQPDGHLMPGRH
jgi:hypothetical protein